MPHLNTPTKNGGGGRNLLIKTNFSFFKKKSSQISPKLTTPNTPSNNQERIIHPGFTLVELIIVITILAILATIAFISFQNYTKSTRDASRTTTLKNLETGLSLLEVKDGKYPTPDDETIYSGGTNQKVKITQGVIGENISSLIGLTHIPSDPRNPTLKYNYSTFGENNQYYQIGINSENTIGYIKTKGNTEISFLPLIPMTYAQENPKPLISGNYLFDPSLPSLFFIPSTQGTDLFHPKNCFILEGGPNTFQSNESDCIKKEEMSLKDYDPSLVGYWDMETTFSSGGVDYLKDLSGNNGFGNFVAQGLNGAVVTKSDEVYNSGILQNITPRAPQSTQGPVGGAFEFDGGGFFLINDDNNLFKNINYNDPITVTLFFKDIGVVDDTIGCENGGVHSAYAFSTYRYNLSNVGGGINSSTDKYSASNLQRENKFSGSYHMYAFSKDNNSINMYVDGVKVTSNKIIVKNGLLNYGFVGPFIGASNHCSGNGNRTRSIGEIDEVKVYKGFKTDQEILQQAKIAGF